MIRCCKRKEEHSAQFAVQVRSLFVTSSGSLPSPPSLQAPSSIISWIKGDYGIWTACVALLVRLFFFIPGELELPFRALLFVIVAPYQVMNLRGTQQGAIIALVIAGYLAFQHFSRAGKLRNAFEQYSIVAPLAIICVTVISCLFLI